jgi:hypothetical protein
MRKRAKVLEAERVDGDGIERTGASRVDSALSLDVAVDAPRADAHRDELPRDELSPFRH